MNYIEKMRAKAQTALDAQKAILDAVTAENRDMTADETKKFDELQAEIDATIKSIERAEKTAAAEAVVAKSAKASRDDVTGNVKAVTEGNGVRVEVKDNLTGAQVVGICAWGSARNKHYPQKSALQHIEDAGFQKIADASRETRKALMELKTFNTITVGTGDNAITTPLSTDFIEFLRNESVFLSSNPIQIDLSYGKLDIPGGNVGVGGSYTAEGADIGYVQASTRKVSLAAKHLTALTAVGNYAIEVSPLAIAQIVGDDLAQGLTVSMDAAGLRGDGTGNNPTGVKSLLNASHIFAATANVIAPTYTAIDADAKTALSKIRASNVPKRRRRWLMSNRVFTYLQFMRDGNGNLVYPGLSLAVPTWHDNIPVTMSEQIPSNLGVGTNESEIYLVDFGHVLMGVARALTLTSSTEASYKDSGGTLVSSFSRDETVIRGVASHDFDMRHDKAGVLITAVKWGG